MKNLYRNMMLVAAAAMSFASCSEDATEEIAAPARQTKTITVNADLTRTEFGASREKLKWSANDQFGIYTNVATDKNITSGKYSDAANGAFSFEVDAAATDIYAYYPYYYNNNDKTSTAVNFGIPADQTWNGPGILYGNNIPMAASGTIEGSSVNLSFKQLACVLALNVYGGKSGETLSSITLTTAEESCGRVDMDITKNPIVYVPTDKTVTLTPYKGAETVAVEAAAVDNQLTYANQVYLVVAKKAYADGAKFVVTTSENVYTFTTKAVLDCTSSDFKAINLDLRKGVKPEPFELSEGDYVVLAHSKADSPDYYAMSSEAYGTSSRRDCIAFDYNGTDAEVTTDNEKIVWHIAKGTAGYNFATYAEPKQYAAFMEKGVNLANEAVDFVITPNNDGSYVVSLKQSTTEYKLTLNGTIGFGFYSSNVGTREVYLVPAKVAVVEKCTINAFTAEWNTNQTAVTLSGTYTSTYATEPTWSLTVSKDGGAAETLEVLAEGGDVVAVDNYTVTEDGTYVFTLTASVNGTEVATKTAEITKRAGVSEYTAVLIRENVNNGQKWDSYANKTATVTGSDNVAYSIGIDNIAYNANYMQIRKSKNSVIYNTTDFGNITSIVIEDSTAATYTVKVGSSQKPNTIDVTGDADSRIFNVSGTGNGYFQITNANTPISHITKITIKYMK